MILRGLTVTGPRALEVGAELSSRVAEDANWYGTLAECLRELMSKPKINTPSTSTTPGRTAHWRSSRSNMEPNSFGCVIITSPAYVVIKAANEFKDKTTAVNQLWPARPCPACTSWARAVVNVSCLSGRRRPQL
ncbi:hypothetical protein DXU06_27795 [Bradyrhizobium elkanii]|nr:hypothetical protein [Bradyrhizobium elkanii]QOZ20514.1 hypothetical protein XI02_40185 [Bradyrhizobium sp. CCBAU 21365]RYM32245.1 hypothetical protein EWH13_01930 [Bradyrhizobium elkanii]